MPIDILQEIVKNKFILILMEENEYIDRLEEMIKSVHKTDTNICYVCLSKPYTNVIEDMNNQGIDTNDFFFIDVMLSHYEEQKPVPNCTFIKEPHDLTAIRVAIKKAVSEKKCSVILFDTISTLLIYQQTSSIVKFAHNLINENEKEDVKKLFIVMKNSDSSGENKRLVSDLGMFADKTLEM
jgi:archaellum biogenesis ATPase FlaH